MKKQIYSQYVIAFEQKNDILDQLNSIKEKMKDFFPTDSYLTFGIPSNFPVSPEMPRISVSSKNNHSNLQISLNQIQLTTKFDENFQTDFSQCYEYLKDRIIAVNEITKIISEGRMFFNGIVSQFVDNEISDVKKDIISCLYKKELSNEPIFDILSKLTYIEDKTYYVNVTVNNIRDNNLIEALGVQLDINSRYNFNYNKEKKYIDEQVLNKLQDLYENIVMNHLTEIIKGKFDI
jgi:hypothetical protein